MARPIGRHNEWAPSPAERERLRVLALAIDVDTIPARQGDIFNEELIRALDYYDELHTRHWRAWQDGDSDRPPRVHASGDGRHGWMAPHPHRLKDELLALVDEWL